MDFAPWKLKYVLELGFIKYRLQFCNHSKNIIENCMLLKVLKIKNVTWDRRVASGGTIISYT